MKVHILLLSSMCSDGKYKYIYENRKSPMLDSNQKFLMSLVSGLKQIDDVEITCITTMPISARCYSKKIIKTEREEENDVSYIYCGCVNVPVIRTLTVGKTLILEVKRFYKNHRGERIVVLCDALIYEASNAGKQLQNKGVPLCGIVTDTPVILSNLSGKKNIKKILKKIYAKKAETAMYSYDGYVFLTEQMDEICNPKHKPFIIMECIITPPKESEEPVDESPVPTVLYAGKFYRECGVITLAKAADLLKDVCNVVLYGGHGDCDEELKQLADKIDNLSINGIVPLNEILNIEKRSSILINPRPDSEEFTKYSFPSKTAEYMMVGKPVVMYRLSGVPREYDKYLNYVESETPEGIAEAIKGVLALSPEARTIQGKNASEFIINNKNNQVQAKRVLNFILEEVSEWN